MNCYQSMLKHVVILTWNRECRHDPAVGVEDVARNIVIDAGDGGTDEIIAGDQETADEENAAGGSVVELEHGSVDLSLGTSGPSLGK